MKMSRRLASAVALVAPLAAFAHPGHDGDHDITWDFGHLASHPLATIACAIVAAAAGWGVWRLLRSARTEKPVRVKRTVGRDR